MKVVYLRELGLKMGSLMLILRVRFLLICLVCLWKIMYLGMRILDMAWRRKIIFGVS